jgi:hypothetical protein
MNKKQSFEIIVRVRGLWPEWKPTPEQVIFLTDTFTHDWLDEMTAMSVVNNHRRNSVYNNPNIAVIHSLLSNKRREIFEEQRRIKMLQQISNPSADHKTLSEWKSWYINTSEGIAEWQTLPSSVRRGLRSIWNMDMTGNAA